MPGAACMSWIPVVGMEKCVWCTKTALQVLCSNLHNIHFIHQEHRENMDMATFSVTSCWSCCFSGVVAQQSEIWFLDRSLCWHFLTSTFTAYYRLMITHLGLPEWQYAYTPYGPSPQAKVQNGRVSNLFVACTLSAMLCYMLSRTETSYLHTSWKNELNIFNSQKIYIQGCTVAQFVALFPCKSLPGAFLHRICMGFFLHVLVPPTYSVSKNMTVRLFCLSKLSLCVSMVFCFCVLALWWTGNLSRVYLDDDRWRSTPAPLRSFKDNWHG